jgi:hypothetical protein
MKSATLSFLALIGIFFGFLTNPSPAATLIIQEKLSYEEDSGVSQKVQEECQLDTKILKFVREYSEANFDKIVTSKKGVKDPMVLTMEISDVIGKGGGAWSGSKAITVKGKLLDEKGKTWSFKARRYSGGGAFGGYKGTCAILGRCTKAIGKDVAQWLKNPEDQARLGDL